MGAIWVRANGQVELRANLRAAIKEAGQTQSGVAAAAGIKYTHLTGGLNGNNWITREAVEALAKALNTGSVDLMGGSIFKDQLDRYPDFEHPPASVVARRNEAAAALIAAEAERQEQLAQGRTRALCCECGTLRITTTKGLYPHDSEGDEYGSNSPGRFIRHLRCNTCRTQTPHALLRVDEHRDCAEAWDAAPTTSEIARRELTDLVERLNGFGVDVHFRPRGKKLRSEGYACLYEYDESKSRWRIEIDPHMPFRAQVDVLGESWRRIAHDDFSDIDWNPRTDGTVSRPGQATWDHATDDLMTDLTRFLSVERRRLVQHLQDELGQVVTSEKEAGA